MKVDTLEGDATAPDELAADQAAETPKPDAEKDETENGDEAPEAEPSDNLSDEEGEKPTTPQTDDADDEDEPEGDEQEPVKETKSQRKRRLRREREEALQKQVAEKDRELAAMQKRLDKFKEVDPNAADDYDAAVAQNASYRTRKAEIQADIEEAEAERNRIAEQASAARVEAWNEKVSELTHIKDFADRVYGDKDLPFTPQIVEVIADMDRGPEVAYHLATHKEELRRLASMPPTRATLELGRIEAGLSYPKPKTKTAAPAPLKTLKGSTTAPDVTLENADYEAYRKMRGLA